MKRAIPNKAAGSDVPCDQAATLSQEAAVDAAAHAIVNMAMRPSAGTWGIAEREAQRRSLQDAVEALIDACRTYYRGDAALPTPDKAMDTPSVRYTPDAWTPFQLAFHRAESLDEACVNAGSLASGWYRRPVAIDWQTTPDDAEHYMLRPVEIAPLPGWRPCYLVTSLDTTL